MDEKFLSIIKEQQSLSPPAGNGRFVPPNGDLAGFITIVGEAPGADEEREGKPFVGASGQFLNRLLGSINVSRTNTYCTNVFKFKPPDVGKKKNDISAFVSTSRVRPNLTPFVQESIRLLIEELKFSQSNIIVAAGATAMYALTGFYDKITKRRGSMYWNDVLNKKIFVVLHPAYLLSKMQYVKTNDWMFLNKVDWLRVKQQAQSPLLHDTKRELRIFPEYNEVMDYLTFLSDKDKIYFDIETNIETQEMTHFSVSHIATYAMSVSLDKGIYPRYTVQQETNFLLKLCSLLENPNIEKVIHNAGFERLIMFRNYGIVVNNVIDTSVKAAIALPALYKRLEVQVSIFTDMPYYKDEGKSHNPKVQQSEEYARYSAKDSCVLAEVDVGLTRELSRQSNLAASSRQHKLFDPTMFMGEYGIKVDVAGVNKEKEQVLKELKELEEKIHQTIGDINIRAPKQLMAYYYTTLGYPPYHNVKTGALSMDEKALKRLKIKEAPGVAEILRFRTLDAYRKYLEMDLSGGRIRCAFNVGGTSQARTSAQKNVYGEGFNEQNLPARFKKFMLPDDGYTLYELDKEQAENRIVAYIAPEISMIRAFEEGQDVHALTGCLVFSVPYEEVKDIVRLPLIEAIKIHPGLQILGDGTKSLRDWGKRAGHGQNYRLGARTLAIMYEMPEGQARIILNKYHQGWPGIQHYHNWVDNEVQSKGYLTNLFGRSRYFTEHLQLAKQRGLSYIPQSTVGELTNQNGVVFVWNNEICREVIPLNIIHDAILIQIPNTLSFAEHAMILKTIVRSLDMELAWKDFTFKIPTSIGCSVTTWYAAKKNSVDPYQDINYMARQIEQYSTQTKTETTETSDDSEYAVDDTLVVEDDGNDSYDN